MKKPDDLKVDFSAPGVRRMKVVFIRHGESAWNTVFNKGSKLLVPLKLARALAAEAALLFDQDSVFIDSPLCDEGIQQAWGLLTFLTSQKTGCLQEKSDTLPVEKLKVEDLATIIRGDTGRSVVVSSNLRRAISTGALALSARLLQRPDEKIHIMTCLQEISRNVDTLSLTPPRALPQVPATEAGLKNMGGLMVEFYRKRLDAKGNTGNKTRDQRAVKRQEEFNRYLFEEASRQYDTVIVCGHSIFFREFFKSYLPKATEHVAKRKKIVNGGCIAFDIYKSEQNVLRIDPNSIMEVYGGFDDKQKKKKA